MFITKKHISRRTVLKGMGVTVALPFLDAMVPARSAWAKAARRQDPPRVHRDGARVGGQHARSASRRTSGRRPASGATSTCRRAA